MPVTTTLESVLVLVGLITWAVCGVWFVSHGLAPKPAFFAWLAFVAPFVLVTTGRVKGRAALALLFAQSGCAIVMGAFSRNLPAALLAVVAGQLPFFFSRRPGVAVLAAQTLLFGAGMLWFEPLRDAALLCISYSAFELFAFGSATLMVNEQRAKEALAQVNAELLATQALLEHSSRELERQRVSRELHDVLGHHLTALSLQLEVARNVAEGRALEPVNKAYELSKGALSEVRQVVTALREAQPLDLSAAVKQVISAVPGLTVHLDAPGLSTVDAPRAALAVLRCVQEAVTNTARHSGAKNLWLTVKQENEQLVVGARDDGHGAAAVKKGNGLDGLTGRVADLGGVLTVETRPGEGFTLTARIPLGARGAA